MSDATERFDLPFILPGQAQKEVFHNEALTAIDMMLHPAVEGGALDTPPASPEPGQCWIVAAAPTGAWADRPNSLAMWTEDGWRYVAPGPGTSVWNTLAGHSLTWGGSAWDDSLSVASVKIGGLQVLGARQPTISTPSGGTVIDLEAREALDQVIATLMAHGLIE